MIGDVIQVYSGSHGRTIVFCETKKEANELSMNASIKQVPAHIYKNMTIFEISVVYKNELLIGVL